MTKTGKYSERTSGHIVKTLAVMIALRDIGLDNIANISETCRALNISRATLYRRNAQLAAIEGMLPQIKQAMIRPPRT